MTRRPVFDLICHPGGDSIQQTVPRVLWKLDGGFWAAISGTHAMAGRLAIASTACQARDRMWVGPAAPLKGEPTDHGRKTPPFIRFGLGVTEDNLRDLAIHHFALRYRHR